MNNNREKEAQEVLDAIKGIIMENLYCNEEDISLDDRWEDDLGADSLELALIMRDVEEHFGKELSDEGWRKDATVRETCESISRCLE